jgi:nucleotide-binding universal stress UspA family protein
MSWKEILVHVDGESEWRPLADAADGLAERLDAHLVGVTVVRMPDRADPEIRRGLGEQYLEERRRDLEDEARRLGEEFVRRCERTGPRVEWRVADGDPVEELALHARYADLVVLAPPAPRSLVSLEDPHLVASVVLAAGRPVLVIPPAAGTAVGARHVVIGWSATREAARAVADALPLIEAAERVSVLVAHPRTGHDHHGPLPGADVAHYLARHGTSVEVLRVEGDHADAGAVLLERVAALGADLLVMGAYGHSRLRELVLGGATRTVLQRAAVPVLMSH